MRAFLTTHEHPACTPVWAPLRFTPLMHTSHARLLACTSGFQPLIPTTISHDACTPPTHTSPHTPRPTPSSTPLLVHATNPHHACTPPTHTSPHTPPQTRIHTPEFHPLTLNPNPNPHLCRRCACRWRKSARGRRPPRRPKGRARRGAKALPHPQLTARSSHLCCIVAAILAVYV